MNLHAGLRLASLSLFVALISGCGGAGQSSDTLVFGRNKDAVKLDPAIVTDGMSLNVARLAMEGLTRYKAGTFEVVPSLATSWETSRDGKIWRFKLRHNVKFQDGTSFNAAAVKFNFDRWRLQHNAYHKWGDYSYYESQFGGFPGAIRDVKALGRDEVEFDLSKPVAPFLANLAMPVFSISSPDAIKAEGENFAQRPVGTGPYKVSEWLKDDHITLQAFDNYWSAHAKIATLILRDIPDPATSLLELQKGDIDGWEYPQPNDLTVIAKDASLTIYHQPANNLMYLAMQTQKAPFNNVLVRRAINEAIDAKAIVKNFYDPAATVADSFLPPAVWPKGARSSYPYDPADARRLLAAAGFGHGFTTTLWYMTVPRPYLPQPQRVAEAIQADLRSVGINASLAGFEWANYLYKVQDGQHNLALFGWTGDNGDPDNFLYVLLDKDSANAPGAQNICFWRDNSYHNLMLAGQTELDRTKRAAIYLRALELVRRQAPLVPIAHTSPPIVFKKNVRGYVANPDGSESFQNVWLESP
jgi:peptide/nickel transport system substrate-binding protein